MATQMVPFKKDLARSIVCTRWSSIRAAAKVLPIGLGVLTKALREGVIMPDHLGMLERELGTPLAVPEVPVGPARPKKEPGRRRNTRPRGRDSQKGKATAGVGPSRRGPRVVDFAWSPTGQHLLLLQSGPNRLLIADRYGEPLARVGAPAARVGSATAAFASNGDYLAAVHRAGVEIWSVGHAVECIARLGNERYRVESPILHQIKWLPDSQGLVCAGNGVIDIIDAHDGRVLARCAGRAPVAIDPSGLAFAHLSSDGGMLLVRPTLGQSPLELKLPQNARAIITDLAMPSRDCVFMAARDERAKSRTYSASVDWQTRTVASTFELCGAQGPRFTARGNRLLLPNDEKGGRERELDLHLLRPLKGRPEMGHGPEPYRRGVWWSCSESMAARLEGEALQLFDLNGACRGSCQITPGFPLRQYYRPYRAWIQAADKAPIAAQPGRDAWCCLSGDGRLTSVAFENREGGQVVAKQLA